MTEPVLLVDKSDGVATLTLNRPGVLNALSEELRNDLARRSEDLHHDEEVGVVILTGAGPRLLRGLGPEGDERSEPETPGDRRSAEAAPLAPPARDRRDQRIAVTGGFEIALSCDLLIAAPEARFADTHARVGLLSGWGLSARLSRAIGPGRAKELSLTGNYLSAERACEWGLVNRIVPRDELLPNLPRARHRHAHLPARRDVPVQAHDRPRLRPDPRRRDGLRSGGHRMYRGPRPEEVGERLAGIRARGRAQAEEAR